MDNFVNYNISISLNNSLLKDVMRAFPGITFVEGYLKTMEIIQKDILSIYRVINALDLSIFIVALENLSQSFEAAIDTLPEAISADIKYQVELMRDRIETKQFCNCYQKEAN